VREQQYFETMVKQCKDRYVCTAKAIVNTLHACSYMPGYTLHTYKTYSKYFETMVKQCKDRYACTAKAIVKDTACMQLHAWVHTAHIK
jgi:hypothetical protein